MLFRSLASRNRPTLMAVGCSADDLGNLKRILGSILNLILIRAHNIGAEIKNMVNALVETEVSL